MPWTVWCHDMSGTPTEYLSLTQTDYRKNASMWPCDGIPMGWEYGAKVYTAFSRVRIDPDTLTVDPYDYTFSTSSGECHSYQVLTALGWGFAGACGGNPTGRADVDLTGTPFAIASNAFYIEGWMAHGSATYSDDGQVVKVRGGGACGYMLPTDADSTIQLVYNL